MTALPSLNIPISVNTSKMDTDLREAERKMKASAQRMGRIRAAATPAVGALGGGAAGSILGGVAAAGGGSLAAVALAAAVPIYGMVRAFSAIEQSVQGANKALMESNQQFAANEVHLRRLARVETQIAAGQELAPARAFTAGMETSAGPGGVSRTIQMLEAFKTNLNSVAAWWGAFIETGNLEIADLEKQLAEASPYEARQIEEQIRMLGRLRGGEFGRAGEIAVSRESFQPVFADQYAEQILKQLREMNGKF